MPEPALNRRALWVPALGVTATVFLTALGAIALTMATGRVASIWLANAIVLVVLLGRPERTWLLWLGCGLVGNLAADLAAGDASATALALSLCNLVEIFLAGWLIRRWNGEGPVDLNRPRSFFVFFGAGGILAPAASGLLAAWVLHGPGGTTFRGSFRTWFFSDALGILVLVPLFHGVTWSRIRRGIRLQAPILVVLAAGLAAAPLVRAEHLRWLILLCPLFVWCVFRLGFIGASAALFLATFSGLAGLACGGLPPVASDQLRDRVDFLQVFIFANILVCLPAANLVRKLQESEARSRTLFGHVPEAIVVLDLAGGRVLDANGPAERLLGINRERLEDALPLRLFDPQPESDPGAVYPWEQLRARALAGENVAFVRRLRLRGGQERLCEITLARLAARGTDRPRWSPRSAADSGASGPDLDPHVLAVLRDITERRQAEARMREISVAVEQSPVSVVITDTTGSIEYVNPRFTEMTGYTPEEAIGQNPRILKTGEQPADFYRNLWATLTEGRTWRGEFHNRRKDGGLFWEAATIAPVKDPAGRTTQYVAIKEDITSFKAARDAAAESQALVSAIVDQSMDYIWTVEPDRFSLMTFNGSLRDFFRERWNIALKPGMTHADLFPSAPYVDRWHAVYRRALAEGSVRVDQFLDFSGTRSLSLHLNLLRRDGDPYLISVIARDVTALRWQEMEIRKLNEDLERRVEDRTRQLASAYRELEAFSYSVSHDLRAPLRSIDGFSQALVEDFGPSLEPDALAMLGRVRRGVGKMGQLIDDLLKLSRVSQGELDRGPVDLSGLAGRILSDLAQKDPGRAVRTVVAPGLGAVADARLVAIALENLLGNAWKYTGRKAEAEIRFGVQDQGGRPAWFVRDNGSGFDMAFRDKLFVPFQRLHAVTDFEGSGIGLAIVERIVRRHGGRIWAEAEPNRGATFWFTLQE